MAAVTVTTSATTIVASNLTQPQRIGLIIYNNSAVDVEVEQDSGLTFGNGIPIAPGDYFKFDFDGYKSNFFYRGPVYGVVSTGTANVRVWEILEDR